MPRVGYDHFFPYPFNVLSNFTVRICIVQILTGSQNTTLTSTKLNSIALVRKWTITTEQAPLIGEVNAKFAGSNSSVIPTTIKHGKEVTSSWEYRVPFPLIQWSPQFLQLYRQIPSLDPTLNQFIPRRTWLCRIGGYEECLYRDTTPCSELRNRPMFPRNMKPSSSGLKVKPSKETSMKNAANRAVWNSVDFQRYCMTLYRLCRD
jgi:hypothetical protein